MTTGDLVRSRVAAAGYLLYVLAVPGIFVLAVRMNSVPLARASGVVGALQIGALLWELAFGAVALVGSKRVPLMDRMPTEAYASLVAVPIATTGGATAASLALGVERRDVIGWLTFGVLLALALILAMGVPLVMAYRVTFERGGRVFALWDDEAPVASRLFTAERWWANHVATRRWVLAEHRLAWLGQIDAEPATAWPTAWRGPRLFAFRWLVVWAPLAVAGVVTAAAVALVAPLPGATWPGLVGVPIAAAWTTVTLVLRVGRLGLEEQAAAQRIRERVRTLRADLAERAAPEDPLESPSRWRRAWDVLRGRE